MVLAHVLMLACVMVLAHVMVLACVMVLARVMVLAYVVVLVRVITDIYPPIVGCIYPIQVYILRNVHFPTLRLNGTQTISN